MRRLASVLSSIVLIAIFASPVAGASPITVDCTNDPSALRSAVATAPSRSRLVVFGTCNGLVDVSRDLSIAAGTPDARLLGDPNATIGANVTLHVGVGAKVKVTGLTMSSGARMPGIKQLLNQGTLTLVDSVITGVPSNAIQNSGTLTLRHSAVTGNGGGMGNAAIRNDGGMVKLINSTVSNNTNGEMTGAIANASGTVRLIRSTVSGNIGFQNVITNAGSMTFTDSTVADNRSIFAVVDNTGTMSFSDAVVSGNSSSGGGAIAGGGGIANAGTLFLRDSIVRANVARSSGGGIYNVGIATLQGFADRVQHGPCRRRWRLQSWRDHASTRDDQQQHAE